MFLRQKNQEKKGSSNPLQDPDFTTPPSNVSTDLLSHVQRTSSNSEFVYPDPKPTSKLEFDDSNLSIAIRKGVRSCTQHPLSKYVSYENFSFAFCFFTLQLSVLDIPNTARCFKNS
ncbi:hypothetical protein CR513_27580, partial [Mucuna pruriens]